MKHFSELKSSILRIWKTLCESWHQAAEIDRRIEEEKRKHLEKFPANRPWMF